MKRIEVFDHIVLGDANGVLTVLFVNKEDPQEQYTVYCEDLVDCKIKLLRTLYDQGE
jgi:hypothetical protein